MARRKKNDPFNVLTVSEPLSITRRDGSTAHGTVWMHASRRGRFEVEYNGMRRSDERTDYTSEVHIRMIAKLLLRELADPFDDEIRSK